MAILLVYLLMVVMFQSWLDPFIIMLAVPGAFVGILWALAITGTTINVVSLMGSIMAVGIAVSNSILLVSFANDQRVERDSTPSAAAIEAGRVRLRPVLMTALAMILGMIPMAIGSGEGGEQNAPLGRAVIGGLDRRDHRDAARRPGGVRGAANEPTHEASARRALPCRVGRPHLHSPRLTHD